MSKHKKDKADKPGKGKAGSKDKAGGGKTHRAGALPEELREAGKRLVAAANSPAGRQAIAAGLSLAAAAVSATAKAAAEAKPGAPHQAAGTPGDGARAKSSRDTDAMFAAINTAAGTFFTTLFKPKQG